MTLDLGAGLRRIRPERLIPVLTANRDEFDLIQQIARQGEFIHF